MMGNVLYILLLCAVTCTIVISNEEPEQINFDPNFHSYIKNHINGVFTSRKRSIAAGVLLKNQEQAVTYVETTNSTLLPLSEYYLISVDLGEKEFPQTIRTLENVRKVNIFGPLAVVLVKTQSAKNEVLRNLRQNDLYQYKVEYSTKHRYHDSAAIDRIDQRNLPLDGTYTPVGTAIGVHVYVIDSGIRATHQEFTGRVVQDFVVEGEPTGPCDFHGSWVTGLLAGATVGIARNATIHDLKVARVSLDCAFYTSDGIDALEDIYTNGTLPGVINLSWQGPGNTILDDIIGTLFDLGYVIVSAAGNAASSTIACTSSPARAAFSITVGSVDSNDRLASFSNYGNCVDIWAPGVGVIGASYLSDTEYVSASGTSGSTPLVAGVAALYYSMFHYTSASDTAYRLQLSCSVGVVKGITTANNRLVSTYPYVEDTTPSPPPHVHHMNSASKANMWSIWNPTPGPVNMW